MWGGGGGGDVWDRLGVGHLCRVGLGVGHLWGVGILTNV